MYCRHRHDTCRWRPSLDNPPVLSLPLTFTSGRRSRMRTLVVLMLVLLQGCASSSVFSPYPGQAQSWQSNIRQGQPATALPLLEKRAQGNDGLLYLQEKARVEQLAGEHDASRSSFADVFVRYDNTDAEARVRAGSLAAGTASLLTNDNALP